MARCTDAASAYIHARGAFEQISFGERLDPLQRLEVFQRLRSTAARFHHALERVDEASARMSQATQMGGTFERARHAKPLASVLSEILLP